MSCRPPGKLEIAGIKCEVKRLKAREFFQLMGVMSNGLGYGAQMIMTAPENRQSQDAMAAAMAAALLQAIPNAMEEFLHLVTQIVTPLGSEADTQKVRDELANPEILTLFAVADALVENEKTEIFELLGKARAYLTRWRQTIENQRNLQNVNQ